MITGLLTLGDDGTSSIQVPGLYENTQPLPKGLVYPTRSEKYIQTLIFVLCLYITRLMFVGMTSISVDQNIDLKEL